MKDLKIGKDRHTRLERIDIRWHDGSPTLVGWTGDRRAVAYPLTMVEAASLVKRLAGHLAAHHRNGNPEEGD